MALTRFEHYLREENRPRLDTIDLLIISRFSSGLHPHLTDDEINICEQLIADKQITTSTLALFYWHGGLKSYNNNVGSVSMCLSKEQWELLERYFKGLYEGDK